MPIKHPPGTPEDLLGILPLNCRVVSYNFDEKTAEVEQPDGTVSVWGWQDRVFSPIFRHKDRMTSPPPQDGYFDCRSVGTRSESLLKLGSD
jgi:hypothetical protein